MADTVQYRLERMVEELDDLERRGLFTRREIAEIVKQRRKFEYRLKRPSPLKQDYLTYIDYETQLDRLRRLRKKSVSCDLDKKNNKKTKLSVSDFTGVARIMEIYRLAVMRYKGDVDLWIRYLEFCKERKNGRMKKVLAQLLRFHPKVPGVWIYAAAWEFDHNLNAEAARALMQSGLRVCPTSEDLWVEYLRMELTYLNKLKARRVALGEGKGTLVREDGDAVEKQWRDENKDLFMSLDEEAKHGNESNTDDDEESEGKTDLFKEQGLYILRAVYSGAVEALPSSFSLRQRLLQILEATDLAHSEDMRQQILSDMKRDFSRDPKYWEWLARLEVSNPRSNQGIAGDAMFEQLQKAAKVYEEALEVLPSPVMFNMYTKFLMDIVAPKDESTQLSVCTQDWVSRLLSAYEKAELVGSMSEDLACDYVSFYLHLGNFEKARQLAGELCRGELSKSAKLWFLRASMETRCITKHILSQTKVSLDSAFELVKEALSKVPVSESEELWLMALKLFAVEKDYFQQLVEMSITAVAKSGGSDCGFSLSSAVVNFILHKDGVKDARRLYERFLALPRPGLSLYTKCIELEQNLASIGDKESLVIARKLYESALSSYDQNLSLWQDYYSMEIKLGTSETADAVHWRARKTLKNQAAAAATLVASPL